MTRKKKVSIGLAVVALLLIWFVFMRKKDVPVVVETEAVHTGYISESVTATGKIQPVDTISVGTQVSGTIATLHADFNDRVKKGQLLAEIDPTLLQATAEQFRASLAQAESNLTYQEANFYRQKELYATGSISKANYDLALNSYRNAQAGVKSVQAQLKSAEKNLSFTRIYSPVDGVILNRNVSIGQTVAASFNTPTLFVIAKDITNMQVTANVDEADIGEVKEGLRTTFTVDAYLEDIFEGKVKEIRLQPTTSSNVVTYRTLIDVPNNGGKLKPGMTANITIYTKEVEDALLIPAQALKFKPDSSLAKQYELVALPKEIPSRNTAAKSADKGQSTYVWVLEGNKLIQKRIKTGVNDNTQVQVLEGLSNNEQVVTKAEQPTGPAASGGSPFLPKPPQRKK